MSTRVEITVEQLPEQLRPLLAAYAEAQQAAKTADSKLRCAGIQEKRTLQGPADDANRAVAEAHTALLEATREHPLEMRQYSHAQFVAAVERSREYLQAAEAELRAAAGHAAVHGSIRDGRPTVNVERGAEALGKKAALFAVGLVQEAAGALPDGIDN